MRVPLHSCFILHQRAYRETSLLLEVLSRDHGRLALVARGAQRRRHGARYLMQPHQRLCLAWSMRGELGTLTAIEAEAPPCLLHGLELIAAFYLSELLMRLLHRHEAHPELFDAYDQALQRLHRKEGEQGVLRVFEKRLLESLGYGLILDHDVETGARIVPEHSYYYRDDYGPCGTRPDAAEVLEISGRVLLALGTEQLEDPAALQQAKHLMRYHLRRHLGDKPLASRELYAAYLRNRAPV